MGRGTTHNQLRQAGYWVVGGSSAVSGVIAKCVTCKRLRGPLHDQKMADLPADRVNPAPPFTYCAVDHFGPFLITERRSVVKRYGVMFTCMASRAVHLESTNSLSSSAFINCLRRFLSRRGQEMDQSKVQQYLVENGVDWIPYELNTPHSSHMGGVWERQIQTTRRALEPLLLTAGKQLDDESFRTFLTEVESIINSRPLTSANLSSPDAPEPLTPNHLLTSKTNVILPPPGKFQREDLYVRRWWRRVQHLTNEFWGRWRKEYLTELQSRQKWTRPKKNLQVGDIVISKEGTGPRGQWPLARVAQAYASSDGIVRKVQLQMADSSLDHGGKRQKQPTLVDRPVHKLVVLLSSDSEDVSS